MIDVIKTKYFSGWWAVLFIFLSFNLIPIPFAIHSEDEQILKKNKQNLPANPSVSTHSIWRSPESALSSTPNMS